MIARLQKFFQGEPLQETGQFEKLAHLFKLNAQFSTERLVLRPLSLQDRDGLFEVDSDEEICRLSLAIPFTNITEASARIRSYQAYARQGYPIPWAVIRTSDNTFLGTCGITQFDEGTQVLQLGFTYRRNMWGQGYGTEALSACIDFLFSRTQTYRIECHCWPDNLASRRVMEKSGMAFEGILRGSRISRFGRHDACVYAILRPDWETAQ